MLRWYCQPMQQPPSGDIRLAAASRHCMSLSNPASKFEHEYFEALFLFPELTSCTVDLQF